MLLDFFSSLRVRRDSRGQIQLSIGIVLFILIGALIAIFYLFGIPITRSVAALLALLAFAIAFIDTDSALIVLIFSMLLSPEFAVGGVFYRDIIIRLEDVLLIVIFFGWLARIALNREAGILRKTPLNLPIFLYALVCFVATGLRVIQEPLSAKASFFFLLKYLEYFLLFFMVSNHLRSMKQARVMVFCMVLTCLCVSIFGIGQIPAGGRVTAPFEGAGGEPNTLSGYLLLMTSLMFALLLYERSLRNRLFLLCASSAALIVFVYTLSRGGWFSFFPMALALILMNRRHRHYLAPLFIVAVMLLPRAMPIQVHNRFDDTFQDFKKYNVLGTTFTLSESAASRVDSWGDGIAYWKKSPLLGHGIPTTLVMDNHYSRILVETGGLGMLTFLMVVAGLWSIGRRLLAPGQEDPFARSLGLGFCAGLVGLLAHALSSSTFMLIRVMEPFWFLAAIVAVMPELLAAEEGTEYASR